MIKWVVNNGFEWLNVGLWKYRLSFPWRLVTDGKVPEFILTVGSRREGFVFLLTDFSRRERFVFLLTVSHRRGRFPWQKRRTVRDQSVTVFHQGRWTFPVSFPCASDGNRRGTVFLTVLGTFRDGSVRQEKKLARVVGHNNVLEADNCRRQNEWWWVRKKTKNDV